MLEFSSLAAQVAGPVLTPTDAGFAAEVTGFNLYFSNAPEVVVGVATVGDVVAAVNFARENAMHVSILATGHGAHAAVTSGMLINTRRLDRLEIDPGSHIATIGAGLRWNAVLHAGSEFGLAPITGSSPHVGVVGYLLGGGMGPLSRSHGVSSDYVRAITLVTSDGNVHEVAANEDPDLFWALRGGKGGFGIVTEVRIELAELATLYAGSLIFEEEHIETALRAWVDYTGTADDRVSTSVAIINFPPLEQVPPPFRGKRLMMLRFAFPGGAAEGEALAAPLRAVAPLYLDGLAQMPATDVGTIHNDPTEPGRVWQRGLLLDPVDQDFVTTLLGFVGPGTQSPIMVTEVRHEGSATHRDVPGGSAVGGRASAFALSLIGAPNPALFTVVLPAVTDAMVAAIGPWVSAETNINFAGDPSGDQFAKAWPSQMANRLAAIRADVDLSGVFAYGPHA